MDNKSSIVLIFNPEFHAKPKHISVKAHYVREVVGREDVKLEWVEGLKIVADLLIRLLDRIFFQPYLEATKLDRYSRTLMVVCWKVEHKSYL